MKSHQAFMPSQRWVIVAALCLGAASKASAALISALGGEAAVPVEATAEAAVEAVIITWIQGVEGSGAGVPWAWAYAADACGSDHDSASGAAVAGSTAHAHASSPSCWVPPGHAWADGFARAGGPGVPAAITPKASATWYSVSRARAGIGARGASAGHSMAGLVQFLVSNIALDPNSVPRTTPEGEIPELGGNLSMPAEVDIDGSLAFGEDGSLSSTDLFHMHFALTLAPDGTLGLFIDDSTGTFSANDFHYFEGPNGAGFALNAPKLVNVSINQSNPYDDGTAVTVNLNTQASAVATVPEPATIGLLVGLLAVRSARFRRRMQ